MCVWLWLWLCGCNSHRRHGPFASSFLAHLRTAAPPRRAAGWLPDQANRFCATNRGVAIETRKVKCLGNPRTADSFLASALCGGAIGKPNSGFPRARIRDIEPGVQGSACADLPPVLRYFLPPKEHVGRLAGRCVRRDSRCAQRQTFRTTATSQPPHSTQVTSRNASRSRWPYLVWLSVDRCCQPCSAVTATCDVAWRATIDTGRLVPCASRIGTLGARSCCVEVEHSLLEPVVDEQSIWHLSTPRSN